jgi:hypothetical protein
MISVIANVRTFYNLGLSRSETSETLSLEKNVSAFGVVDLSATPDGYLSFLGDVIFSALEILVYIRPDVRF